MRTRTWALAAATAVAVIASAAASPQDPAAPGAPPAGSISASDASRFRGALAWRRAVWTGEREMFAYAEGELRRALEGPASDRDFTSRFLLAHCLAVRGDRQGAAAAGNQAQALAPDFPGLFLLQVLVRTPDGSGPLVRDPLIAAVGRIEEVQVVLARYGRSAPLARELEYLCRFERARYLVRLGQFDQAILEFERAVQIAREDRRPPSAELVRRLSQCHQVLNQYDHAERLIRESIARDPHEPSHYYVLGQLAADQKRYEESAVWYRRALDRKADYPEPHAKLAYLAMEAKDLHRMRTHLESYRALHEARWQADPEARSASVAANILAGFGHYWKARAEALADSGDEAGARAAWLRAKEEFLGALNEVPGCSAAVNQLIQVLYQLGEPADVLDPWRERLQDLKDHSLDSAGTAGTTFC